MLKFERTGPGGHPNSTAPPLLSSEQQDSRPGWIWVPGAAATVADGPYLRGQPEFRLTRKKKKNRSHMTKFVPWRWPFWAIVTDNLPALSKGRPQDESRAMKQVERVLTNSRGGQTNRTSCPRDADRKAIRSLDRAINYLRQQALLKKNRWESISRPGC